MKATCGLMLILILAPGALAQCELAPYSQNFDGATVATTSSCGLANYGTYPSGWTLDPSSPTAWFVGQGATPSANTGPHRDVDGSACSPGKYLYLEGSGGCGGQVAIVEAPCVMAGGPGTVPCVSFRYHMFGSEMGTLELQVYNDAQSQWETVWMATGDQGNEWRTTSVIPAIPTNPSNFRTRFRGTVGPGYHSDMAIDAVSIIGTCPLDDWQVNRDAAHLDVDGRQTNGFDRPRYDGYQGTLTFRTTQVGEDWDVVLHRQNLVGRSSGGLSFPDGQVLNVPLTPGWSLLYGESTAFPAALPGVTSPWAAITLPYCFDPNEAVLSLQPFHFDAASLIGVSLAQAAELHDGPIEVVLSEDTAVAPDLSCLCPGGFTFYGVNWDPEDIWVNANGRITFGAPDTDWSATVAEAQSGPPFCGLWTDLNPHVAGSVRVRRGPQNDTVEVEFDCVPYTGETATASFTILMDCANESIGFLNLQGIQANPAGNGARGDAQILGISPGAGAAVDNGPRVFWPGSSGQASTAGEMMYDILDASLMGGRVGTVQVGTIGVGFAPLSSGGSTYFYSAF